MGLDSLKTLKSSVSNPQASHQSNHSPAQGPDLQSLPQHDEMSSLSLR